MRFISFHPLVLVLCVCLTANAQTEGQETEQWEQRLLQSFESSLMDSLTSEASGCVDCHSSETMSNLVLSGEALEDLRHLLDGGYLSANGPDTLLGRIASDHAKRRMPKDAEPWSSQQVEQLRRFVKAVDREQKRIGVATDEQFPRSLLGAYHGESNAAAPTQLVSYRQLRAKVKAIFDDDWLRGNRDLFAENIAAFGGADFKTRFNESTRPSAAYLSALEQLSRDVASRAYRHASGPFNGWQEPLVDPSTLRPHGDAKQHSEVVSAVTRLYERILFRVPFSAEISESIDLLRSVGELQDTIARRNTKLVFEVTVRDPKTNLVGSQTISINVSGDRLCVQQSVIDQRGATTEKQRQLFRVLFRPAVDRIASYLFAGGPADSLHRSMLGRAQLGPNRTARIVLHNQGTHRNVSFAGVDVYDEDGKLVKHINADAAEVQLEGAWDKQISDGVVCVNDGNRHKGLSFISVRCSSDVEGDYQIGLLWQPDPRNAGNVLVELFSENGESRLMPTTRHPNVVHGKAEFLYDCSDDTIPYSELPASFQFASDGYVGISNRGTMDRVTAAAIDMINASDPSNNFLIDSKFAGGLADWEKYDAGRFGAYNVRGLKLHDDNKRKGQLSLKYALADREDHGWREDQFYRVRVYYPGKAGQELQVPIEVFATQSSPVVRVSHPIVAKSDAVVKIDASNSYTVQSSPLEFLWRQVSGPAVDVSDWTTPALEFVAPRLDARQVAWASLCAALMRHPDFLFTRAPAIKNLSGPAKDKLRLVNIAMDLVGRPPTPSEFDSLSVDGILAVIDDYLNSAEFRDFYFHRIRLYLESQGTAVQDEPARLWSYIAFNGRPFQELLTAEYTVNEAMAKVGRPEYHGKTGLLTTKGFIDGKPGLPHYNYAAQVSMLFLGYIYEVPPEIVEQRVGVTALGTTDPNSVCFSCHKILTPLAFQRLNWNDAGEFRTEDADGLEIDASDRSAVEEYPFKGDGLEAFAMQATQKERFVRTIINTHVNFYFGRPMRHLGDERELYRRLWDNVHKHDFKIRELIRAIVTSPEYTGDSLRQNSLETNVEEPKP